MPSAAISRDNTTVASRCPLYGRRTRAAARVGTCARRCDPLDEPCDVFDHQCFANCFGGLLYSMIESSFAPSAQDAQVPRAPGLRLTANRPRRPARLRPEANG